MIADKLRNDPKRRIAIRDLFRTGLPVVMYWPEKITDSSYEPDTLDERKLETYFRKL